MKSQQNLETFQNNLKKKLNKVKNSYSDIFPLPLRAGIHLNIADNYLRELKKRETKITYEGRSPKIKYYGPTKEAN